VKIAGGMKPRVDIVIHTCIALCLKFARKNFRSEVRFDRTEPNSIESIRFCNAEPNLLQKNQKIIKKFDKVRVRTRI